MADQEQTEQGPEKEQSPSPANGLPPPGRSTPERADTGPVAPRDPALPAPGAAQIVPAPPAVPPPPAVPIVPKRLFLVNLGWSVLLVISVTIWFVRHMEHLFTGALIGGGVLTVLMAVQIAYSAVKWAAEEEMKTIPAKLLGAAWSRKVIIILLLASLGLHLFTSSLYLVSTSADASQDCTAEIVEATSGQPFVPPMTVTHEDKIAGKLFFFRLRSTRLRFALVEPRGYEQKIERFGMGSAIVLRTPADFARKQFHILRIVFGPRLWNNLAEPDDVGSVFYDLRISIGGKLIQIDDVRRQTIDLGAPGADVEYVLKKEEETDRRNDFGARLTAIGVPPEVQPRLIGAWEAKRSVVPTAEYLPGDAVVAALRRRGSETPLAHKETTVTSAAIQTIVLEMP